MRMLTTKLTHALVALLLLAVAPRTAVRGTGARFHVTVLPIRAENGCNCHRPDEKPGKAKLRLDPREGALAVAKPHNAADSELVRRVNAAADDERMPPPKTNRKL